MAKLHFLLFLLAINALAFAFYALDKHLARKNLQRIPEWLLLALALLGGSPAAYAAQRMLRHKTSKTSFQIKFWAIVALQVMGLIYIIYSLIAI